MVKTTDTYIGTTRDGYKIYDRLDSHIHYEQGLTVNLLKNAISKINLYGRNFTKKVICLHKTIGTTHCVKVSEKDSKNIIMAYRQGRQGPTPMVKNRSPEPCSDITIIVRKEKQIENHYTLITAFVGSHSEPEPWDKSLKNNPKALQKSIHFWSTHALIFDPKLIDFEKSKTLSK